MSLLNTFGISQMSNGFVFFVEDSMKYGKIGISAIKMDVELQYVYSENEIENVILNELQKLPEIEILDISDIMKASAKVARNTRRGYAQTFFDKIFWYHGKFGFDRPLQIFYKDDKYAIVTHPLIEKMGFRVSETISQYTIILQQNGFTPINERKL